VYLIFVIHCEDINKYLSLSHK